jgi:hypothetical protein
MRWKNLVDQLEYVDRALQNKQSYRTHVGGNVYCNITDNSVCVDIRQYWKPEQEIVPTKKGKCLRPKEYSCLTGCRDRTSVTGIGCSDDMLFTK